MSLLAAKTIIDLLATISTTIDECRLLVLLHLAPSSVASCQLEAEGPYSLAVAEQEPLNRNASPDVESTDNNSRVPPTRPRHRTALWSTILIPTEPFAPSSTPLPAFLALYSTRCLRPRHVLSSPSARAGGRASKEFTIPRRVGTLKPCWSSFVAYSAPRMGHATCTSCIV